MVAAGVDGSVELVAELARRSTENFVARNAPRSANIYRYLSEGMHGPCSGEFASFTIELIQRLGIWWSPEVYATLPTMVPWCIRDRSCRYDQGPESWGSPRSDGYLRDDNSIIKKLPLPLIISGPEGSSYRGRKPWRGFTACHIWRDLPSGDLAGADPWLYSFVPNLIWLPSWLAPLTDRQGGDVQAVLQRTSLTLFRDLELSGAVRGYSELAWGKLPDPPQGAGIAPDQLQKFEPVRAFFTRRLNYLDKFVRGCDDVLGGHPISTKLVCTRYTQELPALDHADIKRFRDAMNEYRQSCAGVMLEG